MTDWTVTCSEQLALGWYLVSCTRWCRDLGTRLKVEPTEENSYCGSFSFHFGLLQMCLMCCGPHHRRMVSGRGRQPGAWGAAASGSHTLESRICCSVL